MALEALDYAWADPGNGGQGFEGREWPVHFAIGHQVGRSGRPNTWERQQFLYRGPVDVDQPAGGGPRRARALRTR